MRSLFPQWDRSLKIFSELGDEHVHTASIEIGIVTHIVFGLATSRFIPRGSHGDRANAKVRLPLLVSCVFYLGWRKKIRITKSIIADREIIRRFCSEVAGEVFARRKIACTRSISSSMLKGL